MSEKLSAAFAALLAMAIMRIIKLHFGQSLPEWVEPTVDLVAGLIFFVFYFAYIKIKERLPQHPTRKASGDRLAIFVSPLKDDIKGGLIRSIIIKTIKNEIGDANIQVLPAGISLPFKEDASFDSEAKSKIVSLALKLLRKKEGDLFVWGRVINSGHGVTIDLHYVTLHGQLTCEDSQTFTLIEKNLLEDKFPPELAKVLAATAISLAIAKTDETRHTVNNVGAKLTAVAQRLSPLVNSPPKSFNLDEQMQLLSAHASIQLNLGYFSSDASILEGCFKIYDEMLKGWTRARDPKRWAGTKINIGFLHYSLGILENITRHFEQAITANDEALLELSPEKDNDKWAAAQNNRALTLMALDERQFASGRLEQAISIFQEIFDKWRTNNNAPVWYGIRIHYGTALYFLSRREPDTKHLKEALSVYKAIAPHVSPQKSPFIWARLQINYSAALTELGKRNYDVGMLTKAVSTIRKALNFTNQKDSPLQWANAQHNLGTALYMLGRYKWDVNILRDAENAFRATLQIRNREKFPREWSGSILDLCTVLKDIAQITNDITLLLEAISLSESALKIVTKENEPQRWAHYNQNLGYYYHALAELEASSDEPHRILEALSKAEKYLSCAFDILDEHATPLEWARAKDQLAVVYFTYINSPTIGVIDDALFKKGLDSINDALRVRKQIGNLDEWIDSQINKGNILLYMGQYSEGTEYYDQAASIFEEISQVIKWTSRKYDIFMQNLRLAGKQLDRRYLEMAQKSE